MIAPNSANSTGRAKDWGRASAGLRGTGMEFCIEFEKLFSERTVLKEAYELLPTGKFTQEENFWR
jgi:hypothetical protein